VSIPRGFALVFADLAAGGWSWRAWSDPANRSTWLYAGRLVDGTGDEFRILAVWQDGSWSAGLARHPVDPVPVGIGARMLRPILTDPEPAPRWVRPDLNAPREGSKNKTPRGDEGTPPAQRWSPDIAARVQAGMDRIAHYGRTREWT
jgi:hypothetical protein